MGEAQRNPRLRCANAISAALAATHCLKVRHAETQRNHAIKIAQKTGVHSLMASRTTAPAAWPARPMPQPGKHNRRRGAAKHE